MVSHLVFLLLDDKDCSGVLSNIDDHHATIRTISFIVYHHSYSLIKPPVSRTIQAYRKHNIGCRAHFILVNSITIELDCVIAHIHSRILLHNILLLH